LQKSGISEEMQQINNINNEDKPSKHDDNDSESGLVPED
jgi:hypothetical protein